MIPALAFLGTCLLLALPYSGLGELVQDAIWAVAVASGAGCWWWRERRESK